MTPFEYVSVLISIVLGLGITQIVTGIADLIQRWKKVTLYWPHLVWVGLAFFLHLQEWWVLFELRNVPEWRLPTFFLTLLYPINLFILARVLFPSEHSDASPDLRAFYFSNYRKFFLLIAVSAFISLVDNVFIHGHPLSDQLLQFFLMAFMTWGAARGIAKEWIHMALVVVLTVVMLGSIIVYWNDWTLTN
jgi:hypothetical protein